MKTREPRLQKKSRKNLWLGVLGLMIIVIMVGSALNWDSEDDEGAVDYKGLKFASTGDGWIAYKADKTPVSIITNPAELQNISIPEINLDMLNYYQKLYITYNPKERVRAALSQFSRSISLTPLIIAACTEDNEQCADMPLKNCTDAGNNVGVILFAESNITEVSFKNDCLTIKGKDLLKIVDKMIVERAI